MENALESVDPDGLELGLLSLGDLLPDPNTGLCRSESERHRTLVAERLHILSSFRIQAWTRDWRDTRMALASAIVSSTTSAALFISRT